MTFGRSKTEHREWFGAERGVEKWLDDSGLSPVRVLLDGCLPRGLERELIGHDVRTPPEMNWAE